jgi:hypothetical protein
VSGKAKAVSPSLIWSAVLAIIRKRFEPPAPITTYCLPLRPMKVIGTASPVASSRAIHNSFPVRESKARNLESVVAAMNTSPPAVAIEPPMFEAPAFLIPSASSSS